MDCNAAKSHNLENCLGIANVSSPAYRGIFPMGPTFRSGLPPPPGGHMYICQEFYAQAYIEFSIYVTSC